MPSLHTVHRVPAAAAKPAAKPGDGVASLLSAFDALLAPLPPVRAPSHHRRYPRLLPVTTLSCDHPVVIPYKTHPPQAADGSATTEPALKPAASGASSHVAAPRQPVQGTPDLFSFLDALFSDDFSPRSNVEQWGAPARGARPAKSTACWSRTLNATRRLLPSHL